MPSLLLGTVTLLFTDIEGRRVLRVLGDSYADALAGASAVLRFARR